ncbi:MAG: ABC transporter permease [Bacteroidales bacterium]|nr:ABC transporter permease [Bacteroidales bacterium]
MIRHFFRLLIQRNFKRNGFHTLINVLGLSIGLTSFILFVLFIQKVRNYDTFHDNYQNLYRVIKETNDSRGNFAGTPAQLGAYLSDRVPEIENYTRIEEVKNITVTKDQEKFFESDLLYVDNEFFEMFSFPIVRGNVQKPIENINSLVITESLAQKYFGDMDPIGQTLRLGRKEKEYQITAVVQNCPENSSIKYDLIISFEVFDKDAYWGQFNYSTYLLINNNEKIAEEKIKTCAVDIGDRVMELSNLKLQAFKDLRFEKIRGNSFKTIDRKYIYIFFSATIFILLLAIINYTNLSSAVSLKRSKEVALKKISGSQRKNIIIEFLTESILFSIIALIVALISVELLSPGFGNLINEEINLSYTLIPYFLLISIFVGLVAGIYPSIYGSQYNIMLLLKESFYKGKKAKKFRNLLVVIQFSITGFLFISAISFSNQLDFMFNRELGLNTDNVYEIEVHWSGIKLKELKNELKSFTGIENVCTSTFTAGEEGWNQTATWEGVDETNQINMFVLLSDKDFISTLGIKFIEKLDDYENISLDNGDFFIINKSAKDHIGWDNSINRFFTVFSDTTGKVVGVVDDFNFRSLHYKSSPSTIRVREKPVADKMHVKIKSGYEVEVINLIEQKWKEFAPINAPLIITSLTKEFENLYSTEKKTKKIVILFTIIATVISVLGLIGLATYITLQRTKEIGIRKVLGSNTTKIIVMLVGDFIKWVLISFVIAAPIAYLYINKWLQNYAYQSNITVWVFVLAGFLTIAVAFISVFILAFRAAKRNPVDSLRYE